MAFRVQYVGEDDLPDDHPWVMAGTERDYVLLIKESCVTEAMLEDSWGAYEYLRETCPPPDEWHADKPETNRPPHLRRLPIPTRGGAMLRSA